MRCWYVSKLLLHQFLNIFEKQLGAKMFSIYRFSLLDSCGNVLNSSLVSFFLRLKFKGYGS